MEICPVDRSWLHTYVLKPYLEGCELITQAWNGFNWSLEHNPLSLIDRVICWITGALLMIPLVTTIIWIAWQTFGEPEEMSAPFCPEIDLPPPIPPAPEIIIPDGREGEREQFGYIETVNNLPIRTAWLLEKFPDLIVATQNASADEFSSSSVYRPDYSLKELHYQTGTKRIDFSMNNFSQVLCKISEKDEIKIQKTLEIPRDGRPWIQQRIIGFRPFVLSDNEEMEFYAVVPEYPPSFTGWVLSRFLQKSPFVARVKATKRGIEEGLLKVKITSMDGWPYNTVRSELWFEPESGSLKKFVDSGTYINQKVGELVQNDPLPG